MGSKWLAVVGCLCILVSAANSAALPTTDTLVVTKADEQQTTASPSDGEIIAETTAKPETAVSTEEPAPPVKVYEMDVRSEVTMRYARTAVVTRVRNPAKRAQEAFFRVLLPETAFISGFTMILDGKSYKAYVKKKEEAKQIYNDAVSQGIGAAHIATKARDSNHFTVSVNVEPNTTAVFNLTYEELLIRRNNVYNHAINLHPGSLVPKLTVTVHIKESQKITTLRVPEVRTGNEIDATEEDPQNTKATIVRGKDEKEATITFTPDLDEQKRLVDIYLAKTKESQSQSHRWYYGPREEDDESQTEGVLGQFVVQYDVDRPDKGEVLVNDGYFVHFFAPSSLPPLNKHVVFVLDTSGSMAERKIEQLRQAMKTILTELNPGDYFSIVSFASAVQVHDLAEADKEPPKSTSYYFEWDGPPAVLVPPYPATPDNVAKAKVIVQRLTANGGTNIAVALDVAVELIQKGINWKPTPNNTKPEALPSPLSVEAGQSTEKQPGEKPEQKPAEATTEAATTEVETEARAIKTADKKTDNKLEPIIIFLTDGDPTVGEVNPKRIISRLSEKNYGDKKASIFSLAFGEDADRKFLRKLSLKNDGFMRHIYEAADAALQLRDFYRQVASPLLADVKFIYPKEQIKEGSVTKHEFRTVYAGSEAVVAGRYVDVDAVDFQPGVIGICGVVDQPEIRKKFEATPRIIRDRGDYLPLERVWAYLTIKQLLDDRDAADGGEDADDDKKKEVEDKALDIALKYEFVTPLTSLVVVKPNDTKAVDAESVDNQDRPEALGVGLSGPPGSSALYFSQPRPSYAFKSAFSSNVGPGIAGAPGVLGAGGIALSMSAPSGPLTDEAAVEDYEESDRIYSNLSGSVPILSTTAPRAPPPQADTLEAYHLTDFGWLRGLKQADSDNILVPGNNTTLELSKDDDAPKESTGDAECARATDGAAGVCVYLTRCSAARDITPETYSETFCSITNKYAGICCPKAKVDENTN